MLHKLSARYWARRLRRCSHALRAAYKTSGGASKSNIKVPTDQSPTSRAARGRSPRPDPFTEGNSSSFEFPRYSRTYDPQPRRLPQLTAPSIRKGLRHSAQRCTAGGQRGGGPTLGEWWRMTLNSERVASGPQEPRGGTRNKHPHQR